jgi:hypothetical protein
MSGACNPPVEDKKKELSPDPESQDKSDREDID